MATEIERKFLLADERWRDEVIGTATMRQGYLNQPERCSVRVRISGDSAALNIKAAVMGAARAEYEYAIPVADAVEMLDTLAFEPLVEKTRHYVLRGPYTWEIDEFSGANAGLIVAEIELPAADAVFERPDWLGREVTDERRYYNSSLVKAPYSTWADRT